MGTPEAGSGSAPAPAVSNKKLIFIHVPKTAGNGILNQLRKLVPKGQLKRKHAKLPGESSLADIADYAVVGGHINWHDLEHVPFPKRSFMVLRDGRERMASMYFFARRNAERAAGGPEPMTTWHRNILELSADAFFSLSGDRAEHHFAKRYDNIQAYYLATRSVRGLREAARQIPRDEVVPRAVANARLVDLVCTIEQLDQVENLLRSEFNLELSLVENRAHEGPLPRGQSRFDALGALLEPGTRKRIETFCELDDALLKALFPKPPGDV